MIGNRRAWWALAVALCLLAAPVHADNIAKVTQVDASAFPEITIYVSVTDESGQPVRAFEQDDFQVLEDGKPVKIKDFAGVGESRPVDIVFVFDTTGSMGEEIEGMKNTSIAFADKLRESNRDFRLGLVAFGDEIREVHKPDGSLTADAEEFKGWISRLRALGGGDDPEISLDAVQRAMQMSFRPDAQRIFVLITDARAHVKGDGTFFSQIVPEELIAKLKSGSYTVYVVSYDYPLLPSLARETGGEFYNMWGRSDFTQIIQKIGGLIASQYRLTYLSARPSYDGTRRGIEVRVGGAKASGGYTEKHLINIRSNALIALAFLAPLLLALVIPVALDQFRKPAQRPAPSQPQLSSPSPPAAPPPPQPSAAGQGTCPRCGRPVRPDAKFCGACGQALQPAASAAPPSAGTCAHCGAPLRPGAKFCGACGHRL